MMAAMKCMVANFSKLDKFEGVDSRRWQKKMHFLLSTMSVVIPLKHKNRELTLAEIGIIEHIKRSIPYSADSGTSQRATIVGGPFSLVILCGKPGHSKKDCKGGEVGNKANGSEWMVHPTHLKVDDVVWAVVRLHDPKLKTLDKRGIECIFVVYIKHSKAFRPSQKSLINGTEDIGGSVVPEEVVVQQPKLELRKSKRNRNPKNFGPEFQLYLIEGTRDEVSDQHSYCFNVEDDPKTFDEAMKSQDVTLWKEAINDGMDFIMGNNTWGFRQKSRIDYFDTYAPVTHISTIRLLIALASIHNLIIHHMDVKTTFLNGELDEKQTPKQWHQNYDEVVSFSVYLLNQDDKCVYSKFDESGKGVIICLYVDDILIFGTNQVHVDLTKKLLSFRFSMKGMGEADVILGIRIKHESNGISISQSHYTEKVLKKFNYFDCTPVSTPIDTGEKVRPNNGQAVSQLEDSRVISCLMYVVTCTRLDIAFVVAKLSRYTSNPSTQHWQALQRVLKYLKKTMDYSLSYTGYHSVLEGYTDASWISNTEYNSSTSGWVFLLRGGAISWASKKQTCITSSTMESKFVALTAAGKEAEWLKNLLFEISLWSKPITPISICYDSATTLSKPNVQWKV
ncbi:zinc finger, CCHC-type containing protein [Tanacetum coccineum]